VKRWTRARVRQTAERAARITARWERAFTRHLAREVRREVLEVADALERREPWQRLTTTWAERLYALELRLGLAMMADVVERTVELWSPTAAKSARSLAGKAAGDQEFADFTVAPEHEALVARQLRPALEAHLRDTITVETGTTRDSIAFLLDRWRREGWGPEKQARLLRKLGVVRARTRARLLARTATVWNHCEASSIAYREVGVEVGEWVVTADDLLCPFCLELDGLQFRLGEPILPAGAEIESGGEVMRLPLVVEHPPLHPNCRCTIAPSLESIGVRVEEPAPERLPEPDVPPEELRAMPLTEAMEHLPDYAGWFLRRAERLDDIYSLERDRASALVSRYLARLDELDARATKAFRAFSPEHTDWMERYYEPLWRRYNALADELSSVTNRLRRAERALLQTPNRTRPWAHSFRSRVPGVREVPEAWKDKAREGLEHVHSLVDRSLDGADVLEKQHVVFELVPGTRGSYGSTKNTVRLAERRMAYDFSHELGHHIEEWSPHAHNRCEELLMLRWNGGPPRKLAVDFPDKEYLPDEIYLPFDEGAWPEEYCAKLYGTPKAGGTYATEVLSMGVQLLHYPERFARQDPFYFNWTLGVLRGLL